MRKWMAMLLALAILVSLWGCGGDGSSGENGDKNSGNSPAAPGNEGGSPQADLKPAEFQEITVVDNEECTIKITGLEPNGFMGYEVNVFLENKSSNITYMYSVQNAAINGVQADPFWATEVAPGKKANETITFTEPVPEDVDLGKYTDILLLFRVYDTDDWAADPAAETSAHIYPYGEENASVYSRKSGANDIVLVDNESVALIVTGFRTDDIWGYTADVFLVNKTDESLMFSVDDVSVNGFMIDPFWASSVMPQTCAFGSISWNNDDFEKNNITAVTAIEGVLRIYPEDDWTADDLVNERFTINP